MHKSRPKLSFTVSARAKQQETPVMTFLEKNYAYVPLNEIDSIFGFVEACTLYGGRPFEGPQLSEQDVRVMKAKGIGLRIPLTTHYVTEDEYRKYQWLLEKYHRKGNSIITTNNELAQWIRKDFPKYQLEASVIKNINSYAEIDQELALYDTVVLPMSLNQDPDFLRGIKQKARIRLFANAGCALNCPSKICYPSISRMNKFTGAQFMCSQPLKKRDLLGMIDFDLDALMDLGFHRFKLLRSRPGGKTGY